MPLVPERPVTTLNWVGGVEFTIGDTTFRATPGDRFHSTADRFCLVKRPDLVERYLEMVAELRPRNIVELGILQGGSTAFLNEVARPHKLVAVDREARRLEALDQYVQAHGASDTVKPYFGVDQSDRVRLAEIVAEEFGGEPLDLVIDDASHHVAETRASFNTLFPLLRPGGLYVIEDWAWGHVRFVTWDGDATPLTVVVLELLMACPSRTGLIDRVVTDPHWAVATRGPAEIDPETFDLSTCYADRFRSLVSGL